jgi:S-adenosylmethionine:tRNA ribosyltransferase-isomerase
MMRLSDFDFDLPEDRIALRPARPRDAARLLHASASLPGFEDYGMLDLPGLLRPGDLLVFNDTRTIPAALVGMRAGRGADSSPVSVPFNLHKRAGADTWLAFARKAKRLTLGDVLHFAPGSLFATVVAKHADGSVALQFNASGPALDHLIATVGVMPLPPYIASKRAVDAADTHDYQTLHAAHDGSVATPTAGLHFTERLLLALSARGVETSHVTLHVGAGTFLPVKVEAIKDHTMHAEHWSISQAAADRINHARAEGRRVIAVGTTSLRTLESAADSAGVVRAGAEDTSIFIKPGYQFKVVAGLITNFHLPKSTLLMLVAALIGHDRMHALYQHAIKAGYRFYSYGDACLLWRSGNSP